MAGKHKRLRIGKRSITLDFDYSGERCLERLDIPPTPANIKRAQAKLDIVRAEIALGQFDYAKHFPYSRRVLRGSKTVSDALWEYFEYWKTNNQPKPSTIKERQKETARLGRDFGALLLTELTDQHILAWIEVREAQGRSGRTINNLLTPLRQTINRALRRREIACNPFEDIRPRRYRPREPEPFHVSEVKTIVARLRYEQCRNYAQFNFFTGLRPSEMIALKWCHVNLVKRKASIQEAVVRFKRQDTKTGRVRIVDLAEPALAALNSQKIHTYMKQHGHVFENPLTAEPWASDKAFREAHWSYACKAAGVNYRSPEMLRHGFASLMFERNKPLGWIANQMGNGVEVMAKHYARWLEKNQVELDDLAGVWDSICTNPVGIEDENSNSLNVKGNLVAGAGFEPATFGL